MLCQALSAVLRRKRLVLSTPEWKSIPWQKTPRNLKDILVDVLVDMPGLVEDFDIMRLCADAGRKASLRLELVQKCWEHDKELMTWFGLLCQIVDPNKPSCIESRSGDLVTHIAQVHGMSLFWTTSLVLYSILWMASGPQAELPMRTDPTHHAHNLTEAITILLQPDSGLFGQQSALLLLDVARQYIMSLRSLSPQSEALLEKLKMLRDELRNGLTRKLNTSAADQGIEREYVEV